MDLEALQQAEEQFVTRYPQLWDDPYFDTIKKKHNTRKIERIIAEQLSQEQFNHSVEAAASLVKYITASSLVSVFEKVQLKNLSGQWSALEMGNFSRAGYEMLYGDHGEGFNAMVEFLAPHKAAKWPVITVVPLHRRPKDEVLVKPTTAKKVIEHFHLDVPKYSAKPNWEFYTRYRDQVMTLKESVQAIPFPDNAWFQGFLMMSTEEPR